MEGNRQPTLRGCASAAAVAGPCEHTSGCAFWKKCIARSDRHAMTSEQVWRAACSPSRRRSAASALPGGHAQAPSRAEPSGVDDSPDHPAGGMRPSNEKIPRRRQLLPPINLTGRAPSKRPPGQCWLSERPFPRRRRGEDLRLRIGSRAAGPR